MHNHFIQGPKWIKLSFGNKGSFSVVIIHPSKLGVIGKMKGIAFIKDPDGYWIEIFDLKTIGKAAGGAA
ncbi:unnamed protein product [Thlaspi arvense]|uniref:Lactoylglutathione lyase n=1 Tax=Thlaspi arvense TaxID=13288 RepID=A0AAU9RL16_THLAR|nr:unnamed protein product [Thlaspi arvense]